MTASPKDSQSAIQHIRDLVVAGQQQLTSKIEFPEPSIRLNVEARQHEPMRLFKYLHQSCMLHSAIFRRANQIKLVYLLDGYSAVVEHANPLGIFAMARSLLEFAAFTAEVERRLLPFRNTEKASWEERGTGFFRAVVRARYGTTDPEKQRALIAAGLAPDDAKPLHTLTCIDHLTKKESYAWVRAHYDRLCDYVHHNFSSQTVAATQITQGNVATSPAGGMIYMAQSVPKVVYQYPAPIQSTYAKDETASRAAGLGDLALQSLNALPESPYLESELIEKTGSSLGVTRLTRPFTYDDPCFCGSGMRYGRCHGKRRD